MIMIFRLYRFILDQGLW